MGARRGSAAGALVCASLVIAACLPFPPVVRGPEPTRRVFLPETAGGSEQLSPLQPTATTTARAAETALPAATAAESQATAQSLRGPVWEWTGSTFKDGASLAPDDPSKYTVEMVEEGNALVTADCNFGTGLYKQEGDRLTFGAIGATKMACPAASLGSAFLAQLGKVEGYRFDGAELVLTLQEQAGEMRLRAQPGTLPLTATAAPTATPLPLPTVAPTTAPTDTPLPPVPTPAPVIPAPTIMPLPTGMEV